ncbi:MAG TPA: hypothetical protein VFQ53_01035 [Kofleriaceae bacterium]|nr:hypothetical protein [Kofleriaceae bacterium]
MRAVRSCLVALVAAGCGSAPPPAAPPPSSTTPSAADREREQAARERAEHDAIVASHRAAELEQQTALAVSCSEPKPWTKHERCLPSCYPTEPAAAAVKRQPAGRVELEHVVCRGDAATPFVIVDELDPTLHVQPARGRVPREATKGWQGELTTWFRDAAKLSRGDVVVVRGTWRDREHPISHETLSCVKIAHVAKAWRGKLGDCGAVAAAANAKVTCEAAGNGAARAINVVHYRLAEAKRLQAAGKAEDCQQAALEAIAVARGLPRWRQYKKLNVAQWNDALVYETRFDGVLNEDALFATVASLGRDAEALHATCGGASTKTTVDQEQSFHTCW